MEAFSLVIFGITSNLAQIKLLPALLNMELHGLLPEETKIVGTARSPMSEQEFRKYLTEALSGHDRAVVKRLVRRCHYLNGHLDDGEFYQSLKAFLKQLGQANSIFYLATYPNLYHHIFENLKKSGLSDQKKGWTRLVIEKPIGQDLASAQRLNQLLTTYFDESQIYRLDHYLGKETVQNILTFRFGNSVFEPLLNSQFLDHVQVTAAEEIGVGGRAGYYDEVGALKDVGQNHLLQLLAFVLMERPTSFSNQAVTSARLKLLQSLRPQAKSLVLGQYQGYRQEEKVAKNSQTDTFFSFKLTSNLEQFKGVPIYVRAGKKLAHSVTEIALVFKPPANRLFQHLEANDQPNVLIYRIQPNEGIVFKILTKKPGPQLKLDPQFMQFCYRDKAGLSLPHERLMFDAINGDQTFFNDASEVEAQWALIDQLLKNAPAVAKYKAGSWGPKAAMGLINTDGRDWIEPSPEFCQL